jgi:hypothetical protein
MTSHELVALWRKVYPGRWGADVDKVLRAFRARIDALEALIAQQREEIASLRAHVAELQGAS